MAVSQQAVIDALLRDHVTIQRLSASQVRKVDSFLQTISDELARRLAGQELTGLAQSRLERALARLQEFVSGELGDYSGQLITDLLDIAQHEAESSAKALSLSVGVDFDTPTQLQVQNAALASPLAVTGPDSGKLLKPFVKDWSAVETKRVSNAVRLGVATGQTNAQIVKTIRGTAAAKYQDGVLAITKRNADAVVQTAVQHVASSARQALYAANDDLVEGSQWVATLDNRTCPRCGALDLKVFPLGKGPKPPLHIRCRCATVPVLQGKYAALQQGGTRPAVANGEVQQVSAGTNYYTWLKSQSATFQDFALGPTRGQLLRNGGLSADRFAQLQLDKRFMPMTLEEARQVDPQAFTKAGL